ncbi:MAG: hypothetical protein CVU09_00120 [Bacteroidetes bacterium HGW-Bacteroidetes-4]|nr:MAG: hypothetical protein CVU09_00120 [Bacteroidetes bacterium HGW-Bacteroidetes-4]
MEKLELKHLAPYLPYNIECSIYSEMYPSPKLVGINGLFVYLNYHGTYLSFELEKIRPILHPLSDLTKDESFELFCKEQITCANLKIIEVPTEFIDDKLIVINVLGGDNVALSYDNEILSECPLLFYEWMIEHHYDVYNLIGNELAIDINSL